MAVIYGIHPVLECLKSQSRQIERIYFARGGCSRNVQEIIDLARRLGLPVKFESRNVLDQKAKKASHQGVIAFCADKPYASFEEIVANLGSLPLLVILDSIEDPRNLGAILRTCAAFGVAGVILPKDHAAGLSPSVSKTAEGGLEYLKVARVTNLVRAIQELKERGIWIVGIETDQGTLCHEIDYGLPVGFVLGGEGAGVRRLVRQSCDFLVSIPTRGPIRSLNVSVSAGIVLAEAMRQRLTGK